ncbi:gephyrin-like molybdotransferase Glp [Microbacterium sp. SORGH_AS_0888]|uniref:molybdopterin molybdotransferase MoeA n=1 Tax=Microbacterium sp. SORGH_AS_0888 TaxID=3041791 RepID=UPI00278AD547|nr:gephyrin-like molybdotransferase Glp [Microbacterium sp. SORGH_AS_0888]MDQ1128610.1 molybdopterin molybdotransferase [Microbacterium sp. SORGH_AS_0888]
MDTVAQAGFARRSVTEHAEVVTALVAAIERRSEVLGITALETDHFRTLAEDVHAPAHLPPFDNSQMDGFAVHRADLLHARPDRPVRLAVTGHIAAGDPAGTLPQGEAWAVMTGAPLPVGADAVVPIEASGLGAFPRPDEAAAITVTATPAVDAFVRRAGSDVRAGDVIAPAGAALTPPLIGVLASAGVRRVAVLRPFTVLLIATGSELRRDGEHERPGSILDANTPGLTALLTAIGVRVITPGFVHDEPRQLLHAIEANAAEVDLVVTAGGVSAGAHEVVRDALAERGVAFGSVTMQPGGPQGVGRASIGPRDIPVVALPGNPVSALISAEVFLRPALLAAGGWWSQRPTVEAALTEAADSPAGKLQLRRARSTADGRIELVGGPGSHLLGAFARSDLLVLLPEHVARVEAGDIVRAWRING